MEWPASLMGNNGKSAAAFTSIFLLHIKFLSTFICPVIFFQVQELVICWSGFNSKLSNVCSIIFNLNLL